MSLAYGVVSCAALSSYSDISGDDNVSDLYVRYNYITGLSISLVFPFLIFVFQNDILGDHPKELNQAGLPEMSLIIQCRSKTWWVPSP